MHGGAGSYRFVAAAPGWQGRELDEEEEESLHMKNISYAVVAIPCLEAWVYPVIRNKNAVKVVGSFFISWIVNVVFLDCKCILSSVL